MLKKTKIIPKNDNKKYGRNKRKDDGTIIMVPYNGYNFIYHHIT